MSKTFFIAIRSPDSPDSPDILDSSGSRERKAEGGRRRRMYHTNENNAIARTAIYQSCKECGDDVLSVLTGSNRLRGEVSRERQNGK